MPELPEVETVRRQLAPRLEGRMLIVYRVSDPRWTAPRGPNEVLGPLVGRRVERLDRRGKYLIAEFEDELFLLMHLRMTGNLLYDAEPSAPYTRAIMGFDDEHTLSFVDPRRFGTAALIAGQLDAYLDARLGVEPFSENFTGEHLHKLARGSRAPVKAFLLDQKRIAGVGNIYADEALFRARVHPLREAGRLTRAQWDLLRDTVREALQEGIDANGATIDDFRDLDGARGSFQDRFLVHRRAGEPCPVCGGPVRKLLAAGRGTYVCERCQPRPRSARIVPMSR
ncbi:MAG TPA: bifunctional DNA-formamidopyrimidine glycosylase/DNA-(apurinic or apyrimidinic site) lyase [Conexibacter sp.]|jgi:formamidopyrimidine-DNA glycosylase|nr:bifunctional DNA-formamidopyrimidine glycosylase/DNA-(apurinic or apyrimidinic site) lyase [Conexibacter sp.]